MAAAASFVIAMTALGLWHWDLSIPIVYLSYGGDETWQFVFTKTMLDTGWILTNPYLGAPGVANLHNNPAAQASAIHSVLMYLLSPLTGDAVRTQQVYYLINFPLITLTSYVACRAIGLGRFAAAGVGLLFALLAYRFNFIIYSYLANYFAVPLALIPVFWIATGRFSLPAELLEASAPFPARARALLRLRARELAAGLGGIFLIALSDGYYAFFTLLLLGFVLALRCALGDLRWPERLCVPLLYIGTLMVTVLALTAPVRDYRAQHPEEFQRDGRPDPALVRHPFEAEVYNTTLKLLLAPPPNHRIEALARIGTAALESTEAARQFKRGVRPVSLGVFAGALFVAALFCALLPLGARAGRWNWQQAVGHDPHLDQRALVLTAAPMSIFIFLCSIPGGIGTIVAFIFPAIRGYDRFPLFMMFVLLVGGAALLSDLARRTSARGKLAIGMAAMCLGGLFVLDQIPGDAAKTSAEVQERFTAERSFVSSLEAALPRNAMVYQYPHSQYLADSPHYGWSGWGHARLYLHSTALRWSNGGAKNSGVDEWHARLARLPVEALYAEVAAAGFAAFVVDRSVLDPAQYSAMRAVLERLSGVPPADDKLGRLAYFPVADPGYRLTFDPSFQTVARVEVTDPARALKSSMSRYVDRAALARALETDAQSGPRVLDRASHPQVFVDASRLLRGSGNAPIKPLDDMQGELGCSVARSTDGSEVIQLALRNRSGFDWTFASGAFPLGIGVHWLAPDGAMLRWDDGYRVPTQAYVPAGGQVTLEVPAGRLRWVPGPEARALVAFQVVQDGHAWFHALSCRVEINRP